MKQQMKSQWMEAARLAGIQLAEALEFWPRIQQYYGQKHRHYHKLEHIAELLHWASRLEAHIEQPQAVHLAIWFHDLIYLPHKQNNEAQSARLARRLMQQWGLPAQLVSTVEQMILSTAGHQPRLESHDCRLFLDMDLAILGSTAAEYQAYCLAIRQEYRLYPDFLYQKGRKHILKHFLQRPHIYFTAPMRQQLEQRARENMQREYESL
ncbi:MAG: hypothetical protein D6730_00890 [Bacteroidetes bacterium]|nr:MAG: hypothetical protein D6730_00890 [Bacteroidota bacterium]